MAVRVGRDCGCGFDISVYRVVVEARVVVGVWKVCPVHLELFNLNYRVGIIVEEIGIEASRKFKWAEKGKI